MSRVKKDSQTQLAQKNFENFESDQYLPIDVYNLTYKKIYKQYRGILKNTFRFKEFNTQENEQFFNYFIDLLSFGIYLNTSKEAEKYYDENHTKYDQLIFFRYEPVPNKKNKYGGYKLVKPDPQSVKDSNNQLPSRELVVNKECIIFHPYPSGGITIDEVLKKFASDMAQLEKELIIWRKSIIVNNVPKVSNLDNQKKVAVLDIAKGDKFQPLEQDRWEIGGGYNKSHLINFFEIYEKEKEILENDFKSFLGIDNLGVPEKKEHLINNETLPRTDFIIQNMSNMYTQLASLVLAFKDVFKLDLSLNVNILGNWVDIIHGKKYYMLRGVGGDSEKLENTLNEGIGIAASQERGENFSYRENYTPGSSSTPGGQTSSSFDQLGGNNNTPLPVYGPFQTVAAYEKLGYYYTQRFEYSNPASPGFFTKLFNNFFGRSKKQEHVYDVINPKDKLKRKFWQRFSFSEYFSNKYNSYVERINQLLGTAKAYAQAGFAVTFMPAIVALGSGALLWGKSKKIPGIELIDANKQTELNQQAIYNYIENSFKQIGDEYSQAISNIQGFSPVEYAGKYVKYGAFKTFTSVFPSSVLSTIISWGEQLLIRSIIYNMFYVMGKESAQVIGQFLPYSNAPGLTGRITGAIATSAYQGHDPLSAAAFAGANFVDYYLKELLYYYHFNEIYGLYSSLPIEIAKMPIYSMIMEALLKKVVVDSQSSTAWDVTKFLVTKSAKVTKDVFIRILKVLGGVIKEYFKLFKLGENIDNIGTELSNYIIEGNEEFQGVVNHFIDNVVDLGLINGLEVFVTDDIRNRMGFIKEAIKQPLPSLQSIKQEIKQEELKPLISQPLENIKSDLRRTVLTQEDLEFDKMVGRTLKQIEEAKKLNAQKAKKLKKMKTDLDNLKKRFTTGNEEYPIKFKSAAYKLSSEKLKDINKKLKKPIPKKIDSSRSYSLDTSIIHEDNMVQRGINVVADFFQDMPAYNKFKPFFPIHKDFGPINIKRGHFENYDHYVAAMDSEIERRLNPFFNHISNIYISAPDNTKYSVYFHDMNEFTSYELPKFSIKGDLTSGWKNFIENKKFTIGDFLTNEIYDYRGSVYNDWLKQHFGLNIKVNEKMQMARDKLYNFIKNNYDLIIGDEFKQLFRIIISFNLYFKKEIIDRSK